MASPPPSPLPDPWASALAAELDALAAKDLRRTILTPATGQDARVQLDGRWLLNFTSNNYLGLASHPRVVEGAVEATKQYGAGSGAARLLAGNSPLHDQLEARLATLKGHDSALLFGAGYLANLGVLTALGAKGDVIFSDALNHASIIDGCRLSSADSAVYRHADLAHLGQLLRDTPARRRIIVTETVFSMDGDIAPLPGLVELAGRHDALLVLDEAHATGVLGEGGSGAMAHFGIDAPVVVVGTMSKALGSVGGFVAAPDLVVEYLLNTSRPFIFNTALPPSAAGAALAALDVMAAESERQSNLHARASQLRAGLIAMGHPASRSESAIVPLVIGEAGAAVAAELALRQAGILAKAIRPPTVPPGTSRIRFNVTAAHTEADIDVLLAAIPGPA